jgi:lyso-ornithine lipid O-acyltransferase
MYIVIFTMRITGENARLSLIYSHINGEPVGKREKDSIAWHGNMSLFPHLWNVLGMQRIDVGVRFNPLIQDIMTPDPAQTRKLVSSIAHNSIRSGYALLLAEVTCSPFPSS